MRVRSRFTERTAEQQHESVAPLSRTYLDTFRQPARILAGAAFVAYSSLGTIIGVQSDLAPALASRPDSAILGYGIGLAAAIVIFVAEMLLAEVSIGWYLLFLIPDAWYTYQFSDWIGAIVTARLGDTFTAQGLTVVLTSIFAVLVAYFGERLLFGRRRKKERA